jgi:hypothetical protein
MFGSHKRHSQITVSASSTFRTSILSAAKNPLIAVALACFDRRHISTKKPVHDFTASENVVERRLFAFRFACFLHIIKKTVNSTQAVIVSS